MDAVNVEDGGANNQRPWDRLPGENTLWYGRLLTYLDLGSARTIIGTCNAERKKAGKAVGTRYAESWENAARKFRWRERAAAYDDHKRAEQEREALELRKREQEELLTERKRVRQKELRVAEKLLLKAEELLELPIEREIITDKGEVVIANHPAFRTAAAMAKQFSESARAALDMPAKRTQIDLNNLSTEDLLTLYEQLTANTEEKEEE